MARYLLFFIFLHILTYPFSFSSFQIKKRTTLPCGFFILFHLFEMFGGSVVASRTRSKKLKTVVNKPCGEVIFLEDTSVASRDNKHPLHPAVRFFKIILTTTLAHGNLKLPKKFEEGMPNPVFLKPPDGTKWEVHWTKHDDDIWFQKGLKEFVSENNLNVGDVCVFELFQKIQGLAFKVSISRGAEEPSCPISHGGSSNQSSSHLESDFKSEILTTTAVDEVSTFTSENPFFMITLTPVIRCLNVPMNFVRKHFVNMKRNVIKIQFREKVWHVNYVFYKHASSGRLSTGWTSCARENKLQPRDVCIFELVNREDAILDLHVFRGRRKVMH